MIDLYTDFLHDSSASSMICCCFTQKHLIYVTYNLVGGFNPFDKY